MLFNKKTINVSLFQSLFYNMKYLVFSVCMLVCVASLQAQPKPTTAAKPSIPTFSKPVLMFDNATAVINHPSSDLTNRALKLQQDRGFQEEMVPMKDKKGLRRIAFMATGSSQTNCTPYADMYFDTKDRWISTEEFFSVHPDSASGFGQIMKKFAAALEAKGFRIGICEEGGGLSLWRISTPVLMWYECEIFKKNVENIALAISLDKEPFRAPNQNIYGTAYFDANGNLVRIQAKSKVKTTAVN
jgi:hypothetical protein